MSERYDRQRDNENRDRNQRPRDNRAGDYARSSGSSSSGASRSSYSRDYSRQAGASRPRGYGQAEDRARYSGYQQPRRQPRDSYSAGSRTASDGRYGQSQRQAQNRYRAEGRPAVDRYRSDGRSASPDRYRSDGYRPRSSEGYGQRAGYRDRSMSAGAGRDYSRSRDASSTGSSYSRANRARDTYRAQPEDRQGQRSDGYARDAFDPRKNLQGGRNALQGARGFRASGGGRPSFSFDIADAFQMGKFVLVGIVALIIIIFIARGIYFATPSTFQVDGQEVSLARGTTYQGLVDSGALEVSPGNLVAVDGEVLQERGGNAPKVYLDGEPVADLGAMISDQGNITAENGDDQIEPYSATQEITPIVTQLKDQANFNFYNGVLHVVTDPGQEGIVETRTGETTGKTATVKVQDMKPRLIENLDASVPSGKKLVALTFDDGPNPISGGTEEILAVMAKYNVKGTFFMLGTQVEEYPEEAKKVADAGHQVASHSYSHEAEDYFNQTTEDNVRYQIQHAREVIQAATGVDPMYIRPPGGNVDAKAVMAADTLADGYIGWSVDTFDYELPGVDAIVNTVKSEVVPGSCILMHDGGGDRTMTAEALDKIIPDLQNDGYTFVTVDELVQAIISERNGSQQDSQAPTGEQGAQPGEEQAEGENADSGEGE